MFTFDEEMTDLLMGYCRWRLQIDPVPLDSSADRAHLAEVLEGVIKPGAGDAKALIDLFDHQIASAVVSVDSPRFLAFIPAAPTKASLLFDMVVSASSMQGTSWLEAAGAVAAENQVLELLADFAGLPKGAGGCFVSGGSLGNLSALVAARDVGIEQRGLGEARVRFAVSEEAHASVGRALSIIGAGALIVPTHDHRLTGKGLADALAADEKPETIVGVVATAGTTNAGIIDDLRGIGEVAKKNKLWFHVDAAYGGAGLLSSNLRPSYDGMELADSFIVDPHKWLFAPFDCCALIYRNPELARKVHTQHAAYLDITHEAALAEWNPADYAMHLTRRARGLALWFSLAVNGTDAYGKAVDAGIAIAQKTAEMIDEAQHLELLRPPGLSIVLFRRPGWQAEDYSAWSRKLLNDQIALVTPTIWEGETVARLAFLHPGTSPEIVAEILDSMR